MELQPHSIRNAD